jgi:glycosyltransferase involved in cell wall biosynthesis
MRVLFIHEHCPGHYPYLAAALAARGHHVVFLARTADAAVPGVETALYTPVSAPQAAAHPYLRPLEAAVRTGQSVYRACAGLRRKGFVPDVVCAHSGFGVALFVKEAFPQTPLLCHFEWYYNARGGDAGFLDRIDGHPDLACALRTRNAGVLLDLAHADWGVCPTAFQHAQFPAAFRRRITRLHEGIDTARFRPAPRRGLRLPGLTLGPEAEIVTYATRGMEPYRGFPQVMRAAARLLARRPRVHVVIAGTDTVAYGGRPRDGRSHRERLLAELSGLDRSRLHFVGFLPPEPYRALLQASSVHVYLTVPFVLSWSLLEAMACGCLVVGSDTPPVRELIDDGRHGLLADFFSPEAICRRIEEALDHPDRMAGLRAAARRRIVTGYGLDLLLPRHLALVRRVAAGARPGAGMPAAPSPLPSVGSEAFLMQ